MKVSIPGTSNSKETLKGFVACGHRQVSNKGLLRVAGGTTPHKGDFCCEG